MDTIDAIDAMDAMDAMDSIVVKLVILKNATLEHFSESLVTIITIGF